MSNNSAEGSLDGGSERGSSPETTPVDPALKCAICDAKYTQPKVLPCLHVYCAECLEKKLEEEENSELTCPECKQICKESIDSLPSDFVMCNMLDQLAMEEMTIVCTSCKAKEKAVARCSDCANFLCPNCVTAHQYMRCFENHKVMSFEDLKTEGITIHKPLFCASHETETMKYFCNSCQVPICNECMATTHRQPEHFYERFGEIETKQKDELKSLIAESISKKDYCEDVSGALQNSLMELQIQRDQAKGLIDETFQSYKAVLEKCHEEKLKELEEMHSHQELGIMEVFHTVEKTIEKIEDGSKFTERVLERGNLTELLMLKKYVASQLLTLINNIPKDDVNDKIEFVSEATEFEKATKETFGHFVKEEPPKQAVELPPARQETSPNSLQSSFDTETFNLPGGLLSPDVLPSVTTTDLLSQASALTDLPPLSLGNLGQLGTTTSVMSSMSSIANAITSLPSAGERSASRNSHSPAMSDSGISVDASSGSSGASTPMINLAALTKLGTINMNSQGQITVNGQVIPGLNINTVSGLPSPMHGSVPPTTPRSLHSDVPLGSLLGGSNIGNPIGGNMVGMSNQMAANIGDGMSGHMPIMGNSMGGSMGSNNSSRSQTPAPLDSNIAGLLHQPGTPHALNGLANMMAGPHTPGLDQDMSMPSPLGPPGTNEWRASPSNFLPSSQPGQQPSNLGTPVIGLGMGANPQYDPNPHPPFPVRGSGKMSAMQIRCKFGQLGPGKTQFNSPHGFCLGLDEDIVVADTNNHRIQVFEKTGEFKYQFGIPGKEEGQLWYPRKVAVMRQTGKYVVCDRGNERSRMQIFSKNGHFIKKIAIRYIDIVAGLAITSQGHIVAVDSVSPTVFCIAESGDLLKWFDCSDCMREPSDIAISGKEYFVCDFKGHCVVVFNEDGKFMRRIGCENITNFPNGIDISDAGDVLIGDSHGNRFHVAVFQRDGSLIGEFECPYVKVSRCCGLKITSEGYIVTLAKNNHHVLVLNTLYIA
ncbi:unnamed protein product [Owenia fusiformis]|uniref:Brain tumor protein n=1 Tax=Owenia fusiformis TaxID=6347 RepID=A0A8J1TGN2_OWEFU|nr:unnamed protein product [Owenia fusiformis]